MATMISLQGPELAAWSTGFPVTLLHVGVTLLILLLGSVLYAVITPHRELQLVRSGNAAERQRPPSCWRCSGSPT